MKFDILFERKIEITQWCGTSIEAKNKKEASKKAEEMRGRLHIDVEDKDWKTTHERLDTSNQRVFCYKSKLNNNPQEIK